MVTVPCPRTVDEEATLLSEGGRKAMGGMS